MRQLEIDGTVINDDSPCYVIAEIGNNHQGDVNICRQMFKAAKDAGANAVKLQKRDNKTLFTKALYDAPYENENSYGRTYGEHREHLEFGLHEYLLLKEYAQEIGITFFATAFDIPSARFLDGLDLPAFKIASGDLRNIPLIEEVACYGKPIIISTGGGNIADINRAVTTLQKLGAPFALLHCVASYPNKPEEINLSFIQTLREWYGDDHAPVIGLSSHIDGIFDAQPAYLLGARIIEKHFTLSRSWKGTDHSFSLTPHGLQEMVHYLAVTREMLGDGTKQVLESEKKPIQKMGKGIWPVHAIPAGKIITEFDVALKCPAGGLPPYELKRVIGSIAVTDLSTSEPIQDHHVH